MKTRLDQLLVERGLAPSRTKAAAMIMAGEVRQGTRILDKPGQAVASDIEISLKDKPQYVSRGGDKLASVAGKLKLDFKNKVVADIGSSTGGFSDFALQHGAKKVYAVDVGTGQLDYKLRTDDRVVVMEKTDVRDARLPEKPDIVMIDVSFISLRVIMPTVVKLASPETMIVAMAKPHFEADYVTASKHKGVIKNDTIRRQILKRVEAELKQYCAVIDKADSEVLGRKGNKERFFLLKSLVKK
jgi:23S rRNA (cytidine1920-2'-O)/16S rRNA (cytidine1409-2'-O)-methyltransferase